MKRYQPISAINAQHLQRAHAAALAEQSAFPLEPPTPLYPSVLHPDYSVLVAEFAKRDLPAPSEECYQEAIRYALWQQLPFCEAAVIVARQHAIDYHRHCERNRELVTRGFKPRRRDPR